MQAKRLSSIVATITSAGKESGLYSGYYYIAVQVKSLASIVATISSARKESVLYSGYH